MIHPLTLAYITIHRTATMSLVFPWFIHGWSWIHCIPELLCQGVLSLATMPSLDYPWMVVDALYSWVTLPRSIEPGYYDTLGLSMDGRGYILFLSYFARGSWAWLLWHSWTIHGWSWMHCIPELLCQGVLSQATMPALNYPWMVANNVIHYAWIVQGGQSSEAQDPALWRSSSGIQCIHR